MGVFILALMAVYNARLAKKTGQSSLLWGFLTVVSFFMAAGIVGVLLFAIKHGSNSLTSNPEVMKDIINQDVVLQFSVLLFGVGGGLLIRYILEQKLKSKV